MEAPRAFTCIRICLIILSSLTTASLWARPVQKYAARSAYENLPLSFEANRGQADPRIDFLSRGAGYALSLSPTGAVLDLRHRDGGSSVRMRVVGANPAAKADGLDLLPGISNYLIGKDPAKWRTGIPNYAKVRYRNVYPGVDLIYYGRQRRLEYDLVLGPGANPAAIQLAFEGIRRMRVHPDGDLILETPGGELRQYKPVIYQETNGERRPVAGKYVLQGRNRVRFQIAKYDTRHPLVIDPVLNYSTYLGGSGNDHANGVAVDSAGNVYVGGYAGPNFPVTASYQPSYKSILFTAFVTKLNASGSAVLYSTYLGGTGNDEIHDLEVDSAGNVYVAGSTSSSDFPVTPGAYQPFFNNFLGNFQDAFAAKLNATGTALMYSTYLGGNALDDGLAIAVDSNGNAFVGGQTQSTNFPTTIGAFGRFAGGGFFSSFILKLNASGTAVFYATYLGGSGTVSLNDLAIDGVGNAYATGSTEAGFPATPGAFQTAPQGFSDGFVAKLNAAGTGLVYATYLGAADDESGQGIAVDAQGNAYVIGDATFAFPTTPGAYQSQPNGEGDAFVAKLNAAGSALIYSTLMGGFGQDVGDDIKIDSAGNAYLLGDTASAELQVTPDAFQSTFGGFFDLWFAKLNPSGGVITLSYLGGSGEEFGSRLAIDGAGNSYVVGSTDAVNYPVTPSAYQRFFGGDFDAVVSKIGQPVTVCGYTLSSTSQTLAPGGGGGSFNITAPGGCAWTATSNAVWITVTGGSSGSGNGTVAFSVAANSVQSPRIGTITAAGQSFTITQQGASCGYNINPVGQSFGKGGGTGQVNVTAAAGCSWTAGSNAAWISVTSGNSGTANGSVTYSVANNSGIAPRTGTLTIAGLTLTVNQAGVTPQSVGTVRGSYWILDGNGNGLWDGPVIDKNFFWGQAGDSFVVGDWNGSGKTKAGIMRPDGTWVLDYNGNGLFDGPTVDRQFAFGGSGDVAVVGDWSGSGITKAGVFRAGQWILDYNGNGQWDGPTVDRAFSFGQPNDIPIVGDWNGSGTSKVGVVRGNQWILDFNGNGIWDGPTVDRAFTWSIAADKPMIGDWNGSGTAKAGAYNSPGGFWGLDYNGSGVYDGSIVDRNFSWGRAGDIPVVGDWNGSGTDKVGIVRGGQWILDYNGNGQWDGPLIDRAFYWGQVNDLPVVGRW